MKLCYFLYRKTLFDVRKDIIEALQPVCDDIHFGTNEEDVDIDGMIFQHSKASKKAVSVDRDTVIDEGKRVRLRIKFPNNARLSYGLKRLSDVASQYEWSTVKGPVKREKVPFYKTHLSDVMIHVVNLCNQSILSGHYNGTLKTYTNERDPTDYPLIPKVWIDSIGNHPKSTAITLNFISPYGDPIFPNDKCVSAPYPDTLTIGSDTKQIDKLTDLFIRLRDQACQSYGFPNKFADLKIHILSDKILATGDGAVEHLYTGCCDPTSDAGLGFMVCFCIV